MTATILIWCLILLAIWWTVGKAPRKGRDIGSKGQTNAQRLAEWHMLGGPDLRLQEHDLMGPLHCLRCMDLTTRCRCMAEHRRYRMALRKSDNVVRLR